MESFEFNSVCEGQNYILKAIKTVEGIFDNSGLFDRMFDRIKLLGYSKKKYKQEQELFVSLLCTCYGTNQSSVWILQDFQQLQIGQQQLYVR